MAQLRHDYINFQALDTDILVMVPNGPKMIAGYINANASPYQILCDKGSKVAEEYFQVKKFFNLGTPSVFLVNKQGIIIYAHYGSSLIKEPKNDEPLAILKELNNQ